jgi:hypothetical protein
MARRKGPRDFSAAHRTICFLVDLGGTATKETLMSALPVSFQSRERFHRTVTQALDQSGLATADRNYLHATKAGKDFVADYHERMNPSEPEFVGQIALPRTPPQNKPLNVNKHMPRMPVREGAFDFLSIPSVIGNQRVTQFSKQQYR